MSETLKPYRPAGRNSDGVLVDFDSLTENEKRANYGLPPLDAPQPGGSNWPLSVAEYRALPDAGKIAYRELLEAEFRENLRRAGPYEAVKIPEGLPQETAQKIASEVQEGRKDGAGEFTGGSVSYYSVAVADPVSGGEAYSAECLDIIEALGMDYAEGNAFKAIWRRCAARLDKRKKGYDDGLYDAEKTEFYGRRMKVLTDRRRNNSA